MMTLPTLIIASRAALRGVPNSLRQAALALGANKVQSVFHHSLPAAMPGILTSAIIGMAQALGETAPLLMIGMVSFIAERPDGFLSAAAAPAGADFFVGGQSGASVCGSDGGGDLGSGGLFDF